MEKQKRGDYAPALLFLLTLVLLFAFAAFAPILEAQLRGVVDSFYIMFSIFFIFSAITILHGMFKWYRAAILLTVTWTVIVGINFTALADIQLLSPILGIILIGFFLHELYTKWTSSSKHFIEHDANANIRQASSVARLSEQNREYHERVLEKNLANQMSIRNQ